MRLGQGKGRAGSMDKGEGKGKGRAGRMDRGQGHGRRAGRDQHDAKKAGKDDFERIFLNKFYVYSLQMT